MTLVLHSSKFSKRIAILIDQLTKAIIIITMPKMTNPGTDRELEDDIPRPSWEQVVANSMGKH